MRLLFATGNQAKLGQLRFVAESLRSTVEVGSARELYGDLARYEEVGETPLEIAVRGALEVAARVGEPVMTEDTALYVDALGGEPGVEAKGFLTRHGRLGLVAMLEHESDRGAAVHSACCYATPDGRGFSCENVVHGHIAEEERWGPHPPWVAPQEKGPESSGGGFNAVFVPERTLAEGRTLAEVAPEEALYWSYREGNFKAVLELLADPARLAGLQPLR